MLSIAGRLRLLTEPFRQKGHDPEESVSHFFRRRIGAEAAQVLIGSMVAEFMPPILTGWVLRMRFHKFGKWNSNMVRCFGECWAMRRERTGQPTGLYAPMDGMGAIRTDLGATTWRCGSHGARVVGLTRHAHRWRVHLNDHTMEAENVVLATPVHVTAELLKAVAPETAQLLGQVESSSLALVHRYGLIGGDAVPSGIWGFYLRRKRGGRHWEFSLVRVSFRIESPIQEGWSLVSFHPLEAKSQEPSFLGRFGSQ